MQNGPRDGRPPETGRGVTRHDSHPQSAIPLGGTASTPTPGTVVSECGATVAIRLGHVNNKVLIMPRQTCHFPKTGNKGEVACDVWGKKNPRPSKRSLG